MGVSIEPFKYLLQPVALERDPETGRIVRELPGETLAVYSAAQAAEVIAEFETQLEAQAMPANEKKVMSIECDNPACPGDHGLKKNDPAGWLFVTAEVYGQQTTQHVFCSTSCAGAASELLGAVGTPEVAPA